MTQELKVEDLFDDLSPENDRETLRDLEVQQNSTLARIVDIFEKVDPVSLDACFGGLHRIGAANNSFNSYLSRMEGLGKELTAGDITHFSLMINKHKDKERFGATAGIYLSALIARCNEPEITVHTNHLEELMYLGFKNKGKHLTVRGFGGDYLGTDMKSCRITTYGDVGECVGSSMRGGKIYVLGNAADQAGWVMNGGMILIRGNAANDTGLFMDGGHISIEGNAGSCTGANIYGGEIDVRGDIVAKPRQVLLGAYMEGGKISVHGNVAGAVGRGMIGGEINLYGKSFRPSQGIKGGKVYHNGKLKIKAGRKWK